MPVSDNRSIGDRISPSMLYLIAGIAAGGPLRHWIPWNSDGYSLAIGLSISVAIYFGRIFAAPESGRRCVRRAAWVLLFTSGMFYADCRLTRLNGSHIAAAPPSGETAVIARLNALPVRTRTGARMDLQLTGIESDPGTLQPRSGTIRIQMSDDCAVKLLTDPRILPGTVLRIETSLEKPVGYLNPGGFNPYGHVRKQGIHRTGYVEYPEFIHVIQTPSKHNLRALTGRLKRYALGTIDRMRTPWEGCDDIQSTDLQSVSKALLLGARSEIAPNVHREFRDAGLVHLIAISGLHVGILAGVVMFILGRLPGNLATRCLMLMGFVWFYALLTGNAPPVIRAACLLTLCMAARLLHRPVSLIRSLSMTAVILLLVNPGWIADPGFQLTFTATGGIAVLMSPFERLLRWLKWRWLRTALAIALAAQTATAPVSAAWFNRMGLLSFATGLCMVPLTAVVLMTGMAALVTAGIPLLGSRILHLHATLLMCLLKAVRWESALPGATLEVMTPPIWLAIVLTAGIAWLSCRRHLLIFVVGIILIYGILWVGPFDSNTSTDCLKMWFFDVGNGDCTLVQLPDGTTMLVDAGGIFDSEFDIGEKVVLRGLRTIGIRSLDVMVLTHPHPDHQLGMEAVFRAMPPGEIWLGCPAADPAAYQWIQSLAARYHVPVNVLDNRSLLQCIPVNTNNQSVVLGIRYGSFRALLPGDAEQEMESALLDYGPALQSTVLKAPHHGSRTSSTVPFLEAVCPEVVTIPCGRNNRFGHPHASVLRSIRQFRPDIHVFRSDRHGMIQLVTDGREMVLRCAEPEP